MQNQKEFQIKGNTWGAIALLVIVLIGLFFIARGIFWLLSVLAPILLIAAVIIDHKVVLNYVQWLVGMLKRNILVGLAAVVLSVIGYPIVFAFLLGRAIMNKRIKDFDKQERAYREGELVDFEELPNRTPRVELPDDNPDAGNEGGKA